jgi:uncharacterized RDD family membrane protein YckC
MLVMSQRRQRIGDLLARTIVVGTAASPAAPSAPAAPGAAPPGNERGDE